MELNNLTLCDVMIITVKLTIFSRCPEFHGLPSTCQLVEDPNDICCKIPNCPANVNGTKIIIPIPQYGPGYSGYGKAQYQPVTGSYGQGPSGTGQGGSSFTGQNPGPTVGGTRSKLLCLHSTN